MAFLQSTLLLGAYYKADINRRNPVLNDLWPTDDEKRKLIECANKSYTKLFKYLGEKKLYTMKYCLEMDLVANEASRTKYCEVMNVPDNNDASKVLLHDKKDAIKSPDKILQVVTGIAPVQYPYSFKKIRTALTNDINSSF